MVCVNSGLRCTGALKTNSKSLAEAWKLVGEVMALECLLVLCDESESKKGNGMLQVRKQQGLLITAVNNRLLINYSRVVVHC